MSWRDDRAEALAGFHACVIRSEVGVIFTTGETTESDSFHRRDGLFFIFFLHREAGTAVEASGFARSRYVDQERHVFHLPALRHAPIRIVSALRNFEGHYTQWRAVSAADRFFALTESALNVRVATSAAQCFSFRWKCPFDFEGHGHSFLTGVLPEFFYSSSISRGSSDWLSVDALGG
jgi:hypothetical protein